MTPEERYTELVRGFTTQKGVTREGRGFGSSSLRVGGSIFALLSSRGQFVVKLPRRRVEELIASGEGDRFDPGHGRLMKEWLALRASSSLDWDQLAREAMDFVGSRSR
ncbi:MAG TPA: hypothetical protein VKK19_16385 [Candidatus Dormibacteraeota bacterium]|nr:hypothetical protein [Candidatus Dormibacteraeota bacterium]